MRAQDGNYVRRYQGPMNAYYRYLSRYSGAVQWSRQETETEYYE